MNCINGSELHNYMNLNKPICVCRLGNFFDYGNSSISLSDRQREFINYLDMHVTNQVSYAVSIQLTHVLFMPILQQLSTQLAAPITEHLGYTIPTYDSY